MFSSKQLVLASSSPRRRELLSKIGIDFLVVPSDFDEEAISGSPREVARTLALGKASEVAAKVKQSLVLGADTIVVIDGKILNKPKDDAEAHFMLSTIGGRVHTVITGVAIVDSDTGRTIVDHEESQVHIRKLSNEEIIAYIKTGEPSDKAGAYAVQGIGSTIVDRIEGDYFNVVGLPMAKLASMLKLFDIKVLG